MLMFVIFIALVSQTPSGLCTKHACVPNTKFFLNGQFCFCDSDGWLDISKCRGDNQRSCTFGQTVWQGCRQCTCQKTGQLTCSDAACNGNLAYKNSSAANSWCISSKLYYINCSVCICSASGKIEDSHCASDNSCQHSLQKSSNFLMAFNKNTCFPKVTYIFPCLRCLCSDRGKFLIDNCDETCPRPEKTIPSRRCIPRTFYRNNCNICWCPEDSIVRDEYCTKTICNKVFKYKSLITIQSVRRKCQSNTFLKPKCSYCSCNFKGNIDFNTCLESDCLKSYFKYDTLQKYCSPGEMIPICQECFCLKGNSTNLSYCSNVCSYRSKLNVLEKVLKDDQGKNYLIEREIIHRSHDNDKCEPNSMYLDHGRYCLCPENGNTNFKLCTSIIEDQNFKIPNREYKIQSMNNILNKSCEPSTFVDIDCNTCYCGRNGTIDPKWCTNDNCEAKRIIQNGQKALRASVINKVYSNNTCIPGSISKEGCNFCICPHSGAFAERACTKNLCSEVFNVHEDFFSCEPLAYYLVDCNICLCPPEGVKNVEKCTKKVCEKSFLRSDSCTPGELFSNECNICLCPPSGDKADRVCTINACFDSEMPWKKIYVLSQTLLDTKQGVDMKNQQPKNILDFCFSGEEFEVGCKICVCPDVELKSHATCSDNLCVERNSQDNNSLDVRNDEENKLGLSRSKRNHNRQITSKEPEPEHEDTECFVFNMTQSTQRKECTPGSTYIIRCRQCICPYIGNINYFCRPLPKGKYCDLAIPNFDHLVMGKGIDGNASVMTITSGIVDPVARDFQLPTKTAITSKYKMIASVSHNHTKYSCTKPGKVLDACFICECEDGAVIEEHCFKSDADKCKDIAPTFFDAINKVVVAF